MSFYKLDNNERYKEKHSNEGGGAVVEVAILSLLMVPISIYSIFFYDYAHMNLKVAEAARYAAWEMTALQISDYKTYSHYNNPDGFLDSRMADLKKEVGERWGDDMNSATAPGDSTIFSAANNTIYSMKKSGLTVATFDGGENNDAGEALTVTLDDLSVYNAESSSFETPEDTPNDSQSEEQQGAFSGMYNTLSQEINKGAKWAYHHFHFNQNGFVKTTVSLKMKFSRFAPIYKDKKMIIEDELLPLKASEMLVVDAWDLKNGGNADYGQYGAGPDDKGAGEEYKNQVEKMTFLGLPDLIKDKMGGFGDGIQNIMNRLGLRNPLTAVVRSFTLYGVDNKGWVGYGDKRLDTLANAPDHFYTNVYKDTDRKDDSFYYQVYKRQTPTSGTNGFYMGCKNAQAKSFQECWAENGSGSNN